MGLSSFVLKLINNNVKLSFAVEVIESSFVVLASRQPGLWSQTINIKFGVFGKLSELRMHDGIK